MRQRWPLLVLVLLAVLTRLAFAIEVVARDAGLEREAPHDTWFYGQAGAAVAEGDLDLSRFQAQLQARIAAGEGHLGATTFLLKPENADLYQGRFGERPLLGGLLYPYVIGAALALTGTTDAVRVLQIVVVGLAILGLTYLLALRLTGDRRVAALAFALLALHTSSLAYGAYLLKASLITLLILGLIVAAERTARAPDPARGAPLALGACLALVHLVKGIALLAGPVAALALALAPRGARARRAGLFALGFLAVSAPLIVRNVRAGCGPLHTSSQGQVGMVMFHFQGADGVRWIRPEDRYVRAVLERGGNSNLGILRASIATHPTGGWVALELKKLRAFFNAYESPNNVDITTAPLWLRSLSLAPLPSGALLILALVGLGLSVQRWRWLGFALLGLGLVLVTCLVTLSIARYRIPAFPFLAILGAVGLDAIWRGGNQVRAAGAGLALLAAAVVLWPIAPPTPPDQRLAAVAYAYASQQKLRAARAVAARAIALHPYAERPGLPPEGDPRREVELIRLFELQANLEHELGDAAAALATWQTLQRRYPSSARIAERIAALQGD